MGQEGEKRDSVTVKYVLPLLTGFVPSDSCGNSFKCLVIG